MKTQEEPLEEVIRRIDYEMMGVSAPAALNYALKVIATVESGSEARTAQYGLTVDQYVLAVEHAAHNWARKFIVDILYVNDPSLRSGTFRSPSTVSISEEREKVREWREACTAGDESSCILLDALAEVALREFPQKRLPTWITNGRVSTLKRHPSLDMFGEQDE